MDETRLDIKGSVWVKNKTDNYDISLWDAEKIYRNRYEKPAKYYWWTYRRGLTNLLYLGLTFLIAYLLAVHFV